MKKGKIIILAVVVIITAAFVFSPKKITYPDEVALGKDVLTEMSQRDLATVETSISNAQKRKRANKRENLNFKQIYENAIIMGDSMAMALLDYQLLNPNQVVSKRGRTVGNNEEDIAIVKGLSPQTLFLQYGLNDMPAFRGNIDGWITAYEGMIHDLKESLPATDLYVIAITPLTSKGQGVNEYNHRYLEFNEALKTMCERLEIKFIDPGFLVDPNDMEQYQADGIHPGYSYFPKWLSYMADEADL